jgi:hypothetical protein
MARIRDASGNAANIEGISSGMIHTTITCGTSSVAASSAKPSRNYVLLVNDSTSPIWINFGNAAVANEGIRINASGGSLELSRTNKNLTTQAINAISDGSTKVLLVTESS